MEEVEVDGIVDSAICMKEITEICEDIYMSRNESIQTKKGNGDGMRHKLCNSYPDIFPYDGHRVRQ